MILIMSTDRLKWICLIVAEIFMLKKGEVKKIILKPVFTENWLPNANEIDTKNMKCTWPMQDPMPGDPKQTIFHWLALGITQILCFGLGVTQILVFLDTNILTLGV